MFRCFFLAVLVRCVSSGSEPLVSYHYYQACGCQCAENHLFIANNQTFGNCQSTREGKFGCFLNEVVASGARCRDQVFDSAANAYWSSDACFTPSYEEFPCTTITGGICKVRVDGEIKLKCEKSKEKLLGLEINCNVTNPPCECYNIETSGQLEKRFGPDAKFECISSVSGDRVAFTTSPTSEAGLESVQVLKTWKRKRSCTWVQGQDNQFRCVPTMERNDSTTDSSTITNTNNTTIPFTSTNTTSLPNIATPTTTNTTTNLTSSTTMNTF